MDRFREELAPAEIELLVSLQQSWETLFLKRVARGDVPLIHGDFHLLGNIFVPKSSDDQRASAPRSAIASCNWITSVQLPCPASRRNRSSTFSFLKIPATSPRMPAP